MHRGRPPASRPTPRTGSRSRPGTSYADTGLATGTYYYKVTAEDAAGNISAASNEAAATVADATPPTAPGALAAGVAGSTVDLSWTAATDNVGVVRYNVHRGTTSGLHAQPGEPDRAADRARATPTPASRPGTYFYKVTAEDAAGNVSPVSNTASATVADTTAPSAPASLTATGGAGQASLTWTAATDNVGVTRYNVHRSTTTGFTPSAGKPIAQPTGTELHRHGPRRRHLLLQGRPPKTPPATSAPPQTKRPPPSAPHAVSRPRRRLRLRRGQRHDDRRPVRQRQHRHAHERHLGRRAAGKFGNALSFNGTNASVTVPDSNSLDLTTGMTLEAWVKPTTPRAQLEHGHLQGAHGLLRLRALREHAAPNRPAGDTFTAATDDASAAPPQAAAQHLDAPRRHLRRHARLRSTSTAPRPATWPSAARSSPPPAR